MDRKMAMTGPVEATIIKTFRPGPRSQSMNRWLAWVISLVVGIASGSALFVFVMADISVLVFSAVVYAVTTRLVIENPTLVYGDRSQKEGYWSGLGVGFIVFLTVGLATSMLPVSGDVGIVLAVLVFGASISMWSFGMQYERLHAG